MWTCLHLCASPRAGVWLLIHPTTPTFRLSPTHFLTSLHTHFGLPHPTMAHLSRFQCGHTLDNLGTHLLWCPYGNERTTTHNTLRDVIATIAWENGTHVQKEVSHFSLTTPNDESISLSPYRAFGPWWTSSLLIQLTYIWYNQHWQQYKRSRKWHHRFHVK